MTSQSSKRSRELLGYDGHRQVREDVSQQVEAARRELVAENRVWEPKKGGKFVGKFHHELTTSSLEIIVRLREIIPKWP